MLDKYLEEIKKTSVLTEEQEAALAERICAGDSKAVEKLVTANLRFVVSMASKYQGRGIDLSDLVAEGNIALMRAAKRFEAGRGSRFVSYASPFVRRLWSRPLLCRLACIMFHRMSVRLWNGNVAGPCLPMPRLAEEPM